MVATLTTERRVPIRQLDLPFDRDDYYTVPEAAAVAEVDRSAIIHAITRGYLDAVKVGEARTAPVYIRKADLDAYLERRAFLGRRGRKPRARQED